MVNTKILLLICDGLGDRPISALGGYTPLESARTPAWNTMADRGINGIMDTIDVGIRPGSDVSHLSIFGYDPKQYYPGRGPLEALGTGITLQEGDVALRVNLATKNNQGKVLDRRAGRIKETPLFEPLLNKIKLSNGVKVFFKAGAEHRGALVLRAKGLSDQISDVDAHVEGEKYRQAQPLNTSPEAKLTAFTLNEYLSKANALLEKSPINRKRSTQKLPPANCLLARGAGSFKPAPPFKEKWGLTSACIAGGALEKGIARYLGMQLIPVKGATGRSDTDLLGKFAAAKNALPSYDFIFVHAKATDAFSEDGDFAGKKNFIERIDLALSTWSELSNTLIVTTADHSTPCELRRHSGDPVPLMITGPGVRRDSVRQFGERECARGGLGRIRGLQLMPELINLSGRASLYGS